MANLTVSVVIHCKLGDGKGWRRLKPVSSENGRLRPGYGLVGKEPVKFETYTYQLRSYRGRNTVYTTVGTEAAEASAQKTITKNKRLATHNARLAGLAVVEDDTRQTLAKAVDEYLARKIKKGSVSAAYSYRLALTRFQESAPDVVYVDQINEDTLLDFHAHLRKEYGHGDRTVANSHRHVKGLLLSLGWGSGEQMKRKIGTVPKYDKKLVVAYSRDELSTLFAYIEDMPKPRIYHQRYLYTALRLLEMAGLREREATNLAWTDIDFKREEIRVTAKPDLHFRLKDREERTVPLTAELAVLLQERRKVVPTARLVLGTPQDRPSRYWLRQLKTAADRAGLNCGRCDGCLEHARTGKWDQDGCHHWTLHSFRRTYATTLHQEGFLLTEIRDLLGHSDIKTTMSYIASETRENTKQRMRKVRWS